MAYLPLLIGLLPSFVWLYFFIREDERHPEPKRLIAYAFIAGCLSTFFVVGPQSLLQSILPKIGLEVYSPISLFFLGAIEEFFKFIAIYVVIAWRRDFDEPVDAMVYMIVAALGFAAVENVASVFKVGDPLLGGPNQVDIASLRFVGATLLHVLASAIVGYYWGLSMVARGQLVSHIAEGIGVATLLHAVFNSLILIYGPETFVATLVLVAASFFILNDFEVLKAYHK
jgi:RsiW-degrading membrane proteinase PrsW (M82 family)